MDFSPFDKTEMEQYKAEVKARWGKTAAYKEFEQKTAGQSEETQTEAAEKLMQIFVKFGKIKHFAPESDTAQALVEDLRQCITENYYDCTKPILESLGQMYVGDERFKANIDARGGVGTADFASKAIEIYCTK
ncbi:MAG: TipAS antibiotic-recognition domain-containing protein [Candidatus Fimenecus sp.]